mmetsp:Transcript_8061/g.20351  ORF Transcript_8061/g.20351 Transcript_8061/m.20351 type:complete len:319 (+) Transcript_8061:120-1076(+)|eukprot:CAMPEP_0177632540 /NCGR_PEP_ID=MMETSP0447-20121125/2354_1 /TAXON_ID=0 /ORGANISM="Stygamoeba regulata, Strain BSH-02190019" /LENGTH=318 /DNA_ID=CAMNT_0019134131 /DNA_START=93 /DNA_END=1049 /DNA_ORIENTATION=+
MSFGVFEVRLAPGASRSAVLDAASTPPLALLEWSERDGLTFVSLQGVRCADEVEKRLAGVPGVEEADTVISGLQAALSLSPVRLPDVEAATLPDVLAAYQKFGLACIRQVGSAAVLDRVRAQCDEEVRELMSGYGDFRAEMSVEQQFATRGKRRVDRLLQPGSTARAVCMEFFHSTTLPALAASLLSDFLVDASLIFSLPGAEDQLWHADGPHTGTPYGFCAFVPLIPITPVVGCTQFWPCSQGRSLLGCGPVAAYLGLALDGLVDAGDALVYDYNLMHRGMANTSDVMRPILQFFVYDPKLYREDTNYTYTSGQSQK